MEHTIQGAIIVAVFLAILIAPFVGGYIGIKHGQRHKEEARKRRMKTALLRGEMDQRLLGDAVSELRRDGLI